MSEQRYCATLTITSDNIPGVPAGTQVLELSEAAFVLDMALQEAMMLSKLTGGLVIPSEPRFSADQNVLEFELVKLNSDGTEGLTYSKYHAVRKPIEQLDVAAVERQRAQAKEVAEQLAEQMAAMALLEALGEAMGSPAGDDACFCGQCPTVH